LYKRKLAHATVRRALMTFVRFLYYNKFSWHPSPKNKFIEDLILVWAVSEWQALLDRVAVNGTMKLDSGKQYAFCEVFEFGNAKGTNVRSITSYVIEIGW
jgi:hypothetical protein